MDNIFRTAQFSVLAAVASIAADSAFAMTGAESRIRERLPEIFSRAAARYKALDAEAFPLSDKGADGKLQVPHGFDPKTGRLDMKSIDWWTSGHFPGSLWLLYEATGDEFFRSRATWWTEILEPNKNDSSHHDTGFMMYCSFGNALKYGKLDSATSARYGEILKTTAKSLAKRFSEKLGLIRSWGDIGDETDFLVIPDNMMNLELLEWAGARGDSAALRASRSHALATMAHHFRADGGTYHVLNYCQKDGRIQEIRRGQGASCETAWARGQAWAIYGYTMMYRESSNPSFLAFARKVADFALEHPDMPDDGVPWWDFGAKGEERDSSAAAIMASALLELQGFVPAPESARYRDFAAKQLFTLSSPEYSAREGENGNWILKHGVGAKPYGGEVDVPLDYGDYYYLEALLRLRNLE